jgi:hypothetical protein
MQTRFAFQVLVVGLLMLRLSAARAIPPAPVAAAIAEGVALSPFVVNTSKDFG